MIPGQHELETVVDGALVMQGHVLTRQQLQEVTRLIRVYFAGRYGIPPELLP
jgi:hypothetical protein